MSRKLRAVIAVPLVLVVGLYVATWALKVPPPQTLYKLLTTPTSQVGKLYPASDVPATRPAALPVKPRTLPATVPWKGKQVPVAEFLSTTRTNAFVVLRDGAVAHEWYREGVRSTDRMASWSVAKSLVSLMIGQAVGEGRIREDDRLVDVLPELKSGGSYDTIRIRDLLDMTAGVDVSENYNQWWPFTGTARMYLTRDLAGFVKDHRKVTFKPGSKGDYRSVETQLLGMALAKVEGKPLSRLLAERLWAPVGAQDGATWNLDRPGGIEKAFCCVNATARDYAKIGQLVLEGGKAGGAQVVPAEWIKRISTPAPHKLGEWKYAAQWWHPTGGDGKAFSALGVYGQYVYVDPPSRSVIVKLSDHGDEQDEQDTFDVLRTISRSAAGTR
ncbi:serine hydrolase domain-containing protein [Spirillospora sp. CA-253888]